jgi:hypothetical protein
MSCALVPPLSSIGISTVCSGVMFAPFLGPAWTMTSLVRGRILGRSKAILSSTLAVR